MVGNIVRDRARQGSGIDEVLETPPRRAVQGQHTRTRTQEGDAVLGGSMVDVDLEFPKCSWEGDLFPPQPSPIVQTDGWNFDIAEMLLANGFSLGVKQDRFDTQFE
jgi:hypothetical protein